jgi:hypothetical protein
LYLWFQFFPKHGGGGDPDSLNVTINDTTQNLQVNGSIVVDSSLTVKDSVIMEDNLHVYEKLRLENDANLQKDVYIGNTLKVEGESYFNGDAFFNEKVFLNALDSLDSMAIASFGDTMSVIEKPSVLFVDENGKVLKGGAKSLIDYAYKMPCKTDPNGNVTNPTWSNGMNKIYSLCASVGIHNSNPRVSLDVAGKAYVSQLAIGGADPLQQTASFHLKSTLGANSAWAVFLIENNQRKLMQLNNQGLLNVREVKVDLEAWPDYVFEKNYKLRPLVEVENFIKINGHLPNIPNAKTIESEGVNLGEMNKLLMEKVEELTLYLIEQNKQLQMQNTRIESLEKTIENNAK